MNDQPLRPKKEHEWDTLPCFPGWRGCPLPERSWRHWNGSLAAPGWAGTRDWGSGPPRSSAPLSSPRAGPMVCCHLSCMLQTMGEDLFTPYVPVSPFEATGTVATARNLHKNLKRPSNISIVTFLMRTFHMWCPTLWKSCIGQFPAEKKHDVMTSHSKVKWMTFFLMLFVLVLWHTLLLSC